MRIIFVSLSVSSQIIIMKVIKRVVLNNIMKVLHIEKFHAKLKVDQVTLLGSGVFCGYCTKQLLISCYLVFYFIFQDLTMHHNNDIGARAKNKSTINK